ncbi:hypothetical protein ASG90_17365 [Nocardioides sp. Soil797]|nr:hypothetical protein ASG90_17365 [Nocardioides sp. Soil797]
MEKTTDFAGLDTGDTLTRVEAVESSRRAAEHAVLRLAAHWADLHGDHEGVTRVHGATDDPGERRAAQQGRRRGHPDWLQLGGEGTPVVAEFAPAELAISLRVHPFRARALLADVLDLRHRLTPLWSLVLDGAAVEAWVLREIAKKTRHLSSEAALLIATDLVALVVSLPPRRLLERLEAMVLLAEQAENQPADDDDGRFVTFNQSNRRGLKGLYAKLSAGDAVIGEAQVERLAEKLLAADLEHGVARADLDSMGVARARALGLLISDPEKATAVLTETEERSPARAKVPVTVHLHLSEDAVQAMAHAQVTGTTAEGVAKLEGHGPMTLAQALALLCLGSVTIRPVLDPWTVRPADSYAFTGSLREAVLTRCPADVYPHAVNTGHSMDVDHTVAYDAHGPPGQTRVDNAGPMTRHHHRIKTHTDLAIRQPVPDIYVWRTRHRRYRLVDSDGTHELPAPIGALVFSERWEDRERAALLLETGVDQISGDPSLVEQTGWELAA